MVRGRKRLSEETKEKSGAFAKDPQRRNKAPARVKYGLPPVPDSLVGDAIAIEKWNCLCVELASAGILATIDGDLLESYCVTFANYRRALDSVRKVGQVITKTNGDVARNPACLELNQTMERMIKLMAELGLTPSARSRIAASPKVEEDDPFAELMKRMATG